MLPLRASVLQVLSGRLEAPLKRLSMLASDLVVQAALGQQSGCARVED
jgi:hypothetical protein